MAEVAEITEAPFYLRVARDLYRHGCLSGLDTAGGRLKLRVELLKRWTEQLLDGQLPPDVYLDQRERHDAIRSLESMALECLRVNTLELDFDQYEQSPFLRHRWEQPQNPQAVARAGERLQLVERVDDGVRFRHSIMQAYLGARRLADHLFRWDRSGVSGGLTQTIASISRRSPSSERPGLRYLDRALKDPGIEFLIALVMCCHASESKWLRRRVRAKLLKETRSKKRSWKREGFDMLAAAYQLDAMLDGSAAADLRKVTRKRWNEGASDEAQDDPRTVEAKLRAIDSMAQAKNVEAYDAL